MLINLDSFQGKMKYPTI